MTTQPTFRRPDKTIKQTRPSYVPSDQKERESLRETAERILAMEGHGAGPQPRATFERQPVFNRTSSQPQERASGFRSVAETASGLSTVKRLGKGIAAGLEAAQYFYPFQSTEPSYADKRSISQFEPAQSPRRIFGAEQEEAVGLGNLPTREEMQRANAAVPLERQILMGVADLGLGVASPTRISGAAKVGTGLVKALDVAEDVGSAVAAGTRGVAGKAIPAAVRRLPGEIPPAFARGDDVPITPAGPESAVARGGKDVPDEVYQDVQAFLREKSAADNWVRPRSGLTIEEIRDIETTLAGIERNMEEIVTRLEKQPGGMEYLESRLTALNRGNTESVAALKNVREEARAVSDAKPQPAALPPKKANPADLARIQQQLESLAGAPEPPLISKTAPPLQQAPQPAPVVKQNVTPPSSAAPAGAPPPSSIPPQAAPPEPPKPPTYKVPDEPIDPVPPPPSPENNVIGLRPIQPGLSRMERVWNAVAPRVRGIPDDPIANPALKERARVRPIIESQSNVMSATNAERIRAAFQVDKKGRVSSLTGIDPAVPGAPTIADIAARLPSYTDNLTPIQMRAMTALRDDLARWRGLLDETKVELRSRADVMDGGFYVPRGGAAEEGFEAPLKVGTGFGGRGGRKGFERGAVFESQAEGIEKGFEYAPLGDALKGYMRDAGLRATDQHVVNYFKFIRDETGTLLGETPKMRMLNESPQIAKEMDALRADVARLRGVRGSLTDKQNAVIDDFLYGTYDEIEDFSDALGEITVQRGKFKGQDLREVTQALSDAQARLKQLRPAYRREMQRLMQTPREQGSIGLSGLQGVTFDDAIANAANKVLKREGATRGADTQFFDLMKAVNQLGRGVMLTLDNSAPGIQGLLSAYRSPKNFLKALWVNLRAWADPNVLSSYMALFDANRGRAAGRLGLQDWAQRGLHFGGVQSEFMIGQPGRFEFLGKAPGLREANRAFGYFGDGLRINLADDFLKDEMRAGKTLQQMIEGGDIERIATIVNNMTGWSSRRFGGGLGELVELAPRFMQSRLETVTRAAAGTVRGVATVATLGKVPKVGATLEQRIARRSILQMISVATMLTVAANELRGKETDLNPIARTKDGKIIKNPNFMKVRDVAGRDWSLLGAWDSLAGLAIGLGGGVAQGNPGALVDALRTQGSTSIRDAFDLMTGRDFNYNPTRDNIPNFLIWLVTSHMPISGSSAIQDVREGEPLESTISGGVGDLAGLKSSPLTATERGEGQASGGSPVDIRSRIRDARNKAQQRTNTRDAIRKARHRALAGAR